MSEVSSTTPRRNVKRTAPQPDSLRGNVRAHSTAAAIHRVLRADILSLIRRPGEAILERSLADEYGVSRTPVREAIRQLADEGLIDVFPQAGTFVARIPQGELEEAIVIRNALEETSARLAAERATPEAIALIDRAVRSASTAAENADRDAFHVADEQFHAEISNACRFPGIWRVTQQVKIQLDRYRRLTLPEEGRMLRIVDEHQAVLDAIRRGDKAGAAGAMTAHLGKLLADLDVVAARHPDCFLPLAAR